MDSLSVVLGLYDDPKNQKQKPYIIDLYQTHLSIIGNSMSGKTTILKTLLIGIHQSYHKKYGITEKEDIFILDFNNDLLAYENLPYVTACFDALQEENVRRVFKIVSERLSENIKLLPGKTYAQCDLESRPAHLTFILDGLNSFLADDKYTLYHEMLQRFLREGLSKGLTIVVTASESIGGLKRMLPLFGRLIGLDLSKDDYSDLFGRRIEKPIRKKGRGIVNLEGNVYEFQACFPSETDENFDDTNVVRITTEKLFDNNIVNLQKKEAEIKKFNDKKMKSFHGDLVTGQWNLYFNQSWEKYSIASLKIVNGVSVCNDFTAGIDYYSFEPIVLDMLNCRSIAIYGKKSFGKTNLLSLILEQYLKLGDVKIIFWEDKRNGLVDPMRAAAVCKVLEKADIKPEVIYDEEEFEEVLTRHFTSIQKGNMSKIYAETEEDYNCVFSEDEMLPDSIRREYADNIMTDDYSFLGNKNKIENSIEHFDEKYEECKYTIIVIQNRSFYDASDFLKTGKAWPNSISKWVSDVDCERPTLFVFSDVQPITESSVATKFNNFIDYAFLLDDIVKFIQNRGNQSVFSTQDIDELKEQYGHCEVGDGFFLDTGSTELYKLKFIKQEW